MVYRGLGTARHNKDLVSLRTISNLFKLHQSRDKRKICRKIRRYLREHSKKTGRPRLLNQEQEQHVKQLNDIDDSAPMDTLVDEIEHAVGVNLSERTVTRVLKKHGITRKVYTILPANVDVEAQIEHLKVLESFPHTVMLNFDQSHEEDGKTHNKRGRGKGRIVRKQWVIDNVRFTLMAIASPFGWTAWKIYFNNCSATQVLDFVNNELQNSVVTGNLLLYDNASINQLQMK